MSQIDWSKAPEGATHHHAQTQAVSEHWRKDGFFCNVGFEQEGWQEDSFPLPLSRYTARKEVWNGEGLPPVGTVCEYKAYQLSEPWREVEVIAHFRNKAMVAAFIPTGDGGKSVGQAIADCFRQIRTPEQIAEEEREQAVRAMGDAIKQPPGSVSYGALYDLYDAGCRMPGKGAKA